MPYVEGAVADEEYVVMLQVFQVQHKKTNHIYAMKVMRKDRILQKDHSEYVKSERDLLTSVVHPYIVTLRFSFQVGCMVNASMGMDCTHHAPNTLHNCNHAINMHIVWTALWH